MIKIIDGTSTELSKYLRERDSQETKSNLANLQCSNSDSSPNIITQTKLQTIQDFDKIIKSKFKDNIRTLNNEMCYLLTESNWKEIIGELTGSYAI